MKGRRKGGEKAEDRTVGLWEEKYCLGCLDLGWTKIWGLLHETHRWIIGGGRVNVASLDLKASPCIA